MTKGEINLLYIEIDKLLNDICTFLSEEIQNGFISPKGRSLANTLIERSKHQLQSISLTSALNTSEASSESYVDMQSCRVSQDPGYPEPNEVYSDVIEQVSNHSSADEDHTSCPYASLPAIEVKEGKSGYLYKKEKILFFEQLKKMYAAIFQSWLLIYMNENALKPCQTFDLTHYEAKPIATLSKDVKRTEKISFNLVSTIDSKSYQFTVVTLKDMEQWVVAINRQTDVTVAKRSLPPVPENNMVDELFAESSNDYEPLKDYQLIQREEPKKLKLSTNKKKLDKNPLPLPPRNSTPPSKTVQQKIPRIPSEDSIGSNYDSVGPGIPTSTHTTSDSFSEDDSDNYYDNPKELKQRTENTVDRNTKISNGNNSVNKQDLTTHQDEEDDDETYDYLQLPNTSQNHETSKSTNVEVSAPKVPDKKIQNKIEPPKPKPTIKPKILSSFRQRRKDNV